MKGKDRVNFLYIVVLYTNVCKRKPFALRGKHFHERAGLSVGYCETIPDFTVELVMSTV